MGLNYMNYASVHRSIINGIRSVLNWIPCCGARGQAAHLLGARGTPRAFRAGGQQAFVDGDPRGALPFSAAGGGALGCPRTEKMPASLPHRAFAARCNAQDHDLLRTPIPYTLHKKKVSGTQKYPVLRCIIFGYIGLQTRDTVMKIQ